MVEALLQLEQRVDALYQERGRTVTVFVTTGSHQLESIEQSSFARYARLVVKGNFLKKSTSHYLNSMGQIFN